MDILVSSAFLRDFLELSRLDVFFVFLECNDDVFS